MVSIAARATRGIKLESRKQNRKDIMQMFKEQMKGLKKQLNVCFNHNLINLYLIHNVIEQSCQWRGQFDVRCMAGFQRRCLFCCYWPLDWGGKGRWLCRAWSHFWVYTNEHGTQRCSIGSGIVQDLPTHWNHWEGELNNTRSYISMNWPVLLL